MSTRYQHSYSFLSWFHLMKVVSLLCRLMDTPDLLELDSQLPIEQPNFTQLSFRPPRLFSGSRKVPISATETQILSVIFLVIDFDAARIATDKQVVPSTRHLKQPTVFIQLRMVPRLLDPLPLSHTSILSPQGMVTQD